MLVTAGIHPPRNVSTAVSLRSGVGFARFVETEVSRRLSYKVAWMQSQEMVPNAEASMSKMYGTELTQRVARTGMEILGMAGQLSAGSKWAPLRGHIQRSYLMSASATIAAGTSEIQRNIIAQRGLGLPR